MTIMEKINEVGLGQDKLGLLISESANLNKDNNEAISKQLMAKFEKKRHRIKGSKVLKGMKGVQFVSSSNSEQLAEERTMLEMQLAQQNLAA